MVYASAFSDEEEEAPRDDAAGVDNSASADGGQTVFSCSFALLLASS